MVLAAGACCFSCSKDDDGNDGGNTPAPETPNGSTLISISGAKANIYTMGGAQVAADATQVSVPAGIYVVVAGGKATKVVVK